MNTGCGTCDGIRAYMLGRLAGFLQHDRKAPDDYDDTRRAKWYDGYDREQRRKAKVAAPDGP